MEGTTPQTWAQWYIVIRNDLGIILSLVGIGLTIVGFVFTYFQIRKTKNAATAAKDAADATRGSISNNLLLRDAADCTRNLNEVKGFIERNNYGAADVRTKDLIEGLIEVQQRAEIRGDPVNIEFENILSQLSIVREEIDKKLVRANARVDKAAMFAVLALISDDLTRFSAGTAIAIERGDSNG